MTLVLLSWFVMPACLLCALESRPRRVLFLASISPCRLAPLSRIAIEAGD